MFYKDLRKIGCLTVLFFIILILTFSESFAQKKEYPEKAIKLVVGTEPGGISDLGARALSDKFAEKLGVPVMIFNKPGGGGVDALVDVVNAKPDGYTLVTMTDGGVIGQVISPNIPYDCSRDFIPIGTFGLTPTLIAVNSNSSFNTIEELLDYAKRNPKKLKCGTPGSNSFSHFNFELFKSYEKVDITGVPFKASPQAVTALLGNHVDLISSTLPPINGQLKAGRFRGLATTNKIKEFPNIPTFSEKGLTRELMGSWTGILAPTKIPQNVHKKLVEAFEKTVKDQEVIQKLEMVGFASYVIGPDAFAQLIKRKFENFSELVKKIGPESN